MTLLASHIDQARPLRPAEPVLARKVDDLREIGEHRDDDAGNANELKHPLSLADFEQDSYRAPNALLRGTASMRDGSL